MTAAHRRVSCLLVPPLRIPPIAETSIFPYAPFLSSTRYHLCLNSTQAQQHVTTSLSSARVIRSSTSSGHNSKLAARAQRRRGVPGCPCNDRIPPTHGRKSNLSSSRSCFHFQCTAVGFNAKQRHRRHSTSSSFAPVIPSSTSCGHNSEHVATAVNGGGGIQAAPATTRSHRPIAEIPIFLRLVPVSTSTALRSASTPNRDTISTPFHHRLRQ